LSVCGAIYGRSSVRHAASRRALGLGRRHRAVLLIAGLFVTATRTRGNQSEQDRRARLGLVAILDVPLVGASFAFLGNVLGDVHPADVGYTYAVFTVIGGFAGLLAGVAFGITGWLTLRDSDGKAVPSKSIDITDEL
jgi:multidrug transporter EmrE-like cation transporter